MWDGDVNGGGKMSGSEHFWFVRILPENIKQLNMTCFFLAQTS